MKELLSPQDFSGVATMSEVVIMTTFYLEEYLYFKLQGNPAQRADALSP